MSPADVAVDGLAHGKVPIVPPPAPGAHKEHITREPRPKANEEMLAAVLAVVQINV